MQASTESAPTHGICFFVSEQRQEEIKNNGEEKGKNGRTDLAVESTQQTMLSSIAPTTA